MAIWEDTCTVSYRQVSKPPLHTLNIYSCTVHCRELLHDRTDSGISMQSISYSRSLRSNRRCNASELLQRVQGRRRSLSDEEECPKRRIFQKTASLDDAQSIPPRTRHLSTMSSLPSPITEHQVLSDSKPHTMEHRVPAQPHGHAPNCKPKQRAGLLRRGFAVRRKTITELVIPSAGSKV